MTERLRNVHPGEILQEEFLDPLGITHYRLSKAMGVDQARIAAICHGRRAITADTALRLSKVLGTSAKLWLGLQQDYDIEEAELESQGEFDRLEPLNPPE